MFTKRKINISFDFRTLILVLLFCPLVLSLLNLGVQKIINPENKVKVSFKRNYIPKDQLLLLNKKIKTSLFNTKLIPNRAIDLNNGWYVVGDAFSDALSESKGLLVYTKTELEQLKKILTQHNELLEKNNIKFYLSIAPNKLTVYDSLIPITKKKRNTKLQQVDSLCQTIGIPFINLGENFKNYKDLRLYHKTDTHWNDIGAFIGYNTVINRFKKDFPNKIFKNFTFNNTSKDTTYALQGDMAKMLKIDSKIEFIKLTLDTTFAKYVDEKKHPLPEKYIGKSGAENFELRYKNDKENLKLLVFRDSFWGYGNQFFIENFNETVLIWDPFFDTDIVLKEKPDIVLIEVVERNIEYLLLTERE